MGSVVGEFRLAIEVIAPVLVGVAVVTLLVAATGRRDRVVTTLGAGLFACGVLLIAAATLLPRAADAGVNLTPGATVRAYLDHGDPVLTTRNLLLNVALFVPASAGLVLWRRMPAWLVVAGAVLTSLAIEGVQYVLPLGRTADVDDVLLNTVGAVLGAGAAVVARFARIPRRQGAVSRGSAGWSRQGRLGP